MRFTLRPLVCLTVCLMAAVSLFGQLQPPFILKDISTTPTRHDSNPGAFAKVGPNVLFVATDDFHGTELWKTDGTAVGTSFVYDFTAGRARSDVSATAGAVLKASALNELRNRMK